jgi:predicted MFS family arabinose efflux permease
LGYGPEIVGTLFAAGALSFALTSVPAGGLGARFGPHRMIRVGVVVNAIGIVLLGLTEMAPQTLWTAWLILVQVVTSMGWCIITVNHVPALTAFAAKENRRDAYAMRQATAGAGMLLGSLIGGFLPGVFASLMGTTTAEPVPYRYAIFVAAGLSFAGIVPALMLGPVPHGEETEDAKASSERPTLRQLAPLLTLVLAGFMSNGAVASAKAFISAYMDLEFSLPTSLIGTISSIGQGLAIAAALSGPRIARRQGSGQTMRVAGIAMAGTLLVTALIPHWTAASVGLAGGLALQAMFIPAYQSLQMDMAREGTHSLVAGACAMGMSLGFGSVSFAGGYIVASSGYSYLFLLGALMALLSVGLMTHLMHRRANPEPDAPSGQAQCREQVPASSDPS